MPLGHGKYDDLCTYVREQAEAEGAIVIVFGGNKGPGFAVQSSLGVLLQMPALLRFVADEIERSRQK